MRSSSSEPSGSSSSSSRGCDSSARPSATRWRSPPESLPGRRSSRPPISSRSVTRACWAGSVGKPVHAPAVVEILPDIEMRKQPRVLEHIADAAAMRRDVDACGGVVERLAVDGDAAAIGPQQARDHVDQRGLAGAGGAEQPGDAAFAGERGFDREFAELFGDVDAQHGQFPCRRWVARRANHSEAIRAAIAITMETTTSRSAAVSPSGVWISE